MSPPQERGAGERRGRREEGQVSEVAARDGLVREEPVRGGAGERGGDERWTGEGGAGERGAGEGGGGERWTGEGGAGERGAGENRRLLQVPTNSTGLNASTKHGDCS